jgi:intracellular sulfur oxidation DsrE/DsrF family protein
MSAKFNNVSDEQLNALLDKELDANEEAQLIQAIATNEDLQQRYEALRKTKSLFVQAYDEVPSPLLLPQKSNWTLRPAALGIAASIMLLVGLYLGWLFEPFVPHNSAAHSTPDRIRSLAEINPNLPQSSTILLHISTADKARVDHDLQMVKTLLTNASKKNKPLKLEVVANVDGINILRKGSPYAGEINSLSEQFSNVRFLACGIAKKTAALKEGKPIELIPEAVDIPAALDEILKRLKEGWTYVKG